METEILIGSRLTSFAESLHGIIMRNIIPDSKKCPKSFLLKLTQAATQAERAFQMCFSFSKWFILSFCSYLLQRAGGLL